MRSLAAALVISAFAVTMGVVSKSAAIVFDGVYALVDAAMTVIALVVSHLILRSTTPGRDGRRLTAMFNMGLWHLEPLVVAVNGLMLMSITVYALINGLKELVSGGQAMEFGPALGYSAVTLAICVAMAALARRANRRLSSDLVALDAKSWLMSACVTAALLAAFGAGYAMQGTALEAYAGLLDPATLVLVSLAILPVPLREVRQAVREVLLATPPELRGAVDDVARQVTRDEGFVGYRAYVAEFGKAVRVELCFIVPPDAPPRPIEEWDALRDRVGEAIGGDERHRWLTVLFTADPSWAE